MPDPSTKRYQRDQQRMQHRQAIMLKGRGQAKNIVCPLATAGHMTWMASCWVRPHFEQTPCLHLDKKTLQNWQGCCLMANATSREILQIRRKQDFDFTGFMLDRVAVEEYSVNRKTLLRYILKITTSVRTTLASTNL